jgi:hypothetical protein
MAYASQEQALRPPIREWHVPFVNGRLFVTGLEHIFSRVYTVDQFLLDQGRTTAGHVIPPVDQIKQTRLGVNYPGGRAVGRFYSTPRLNARPGHVHG